MQIPSVPPQKVALVPELEVSDFERSLRFYVNVLGFSVLYDRPERPFAYLTLGAAHIMIEHGGTWITGTLDRPFGRGMNFQIAVPDVAAVASKLAEEGWPLFRPMEDAWYRRGDEHVGARQIVVQDPDGHLLRFSQHLGVRQTQTGRSQMQRAMFPVRRPRAPSCPVNVMTRRRPHPQ